MLPVSPKLTYIFLPSCCLRAKRPAAPVPIPPPTTEGDSKMEAQGIAFSGRYLDPSRYVCAPLSQSLCPEFTDLGLCVDLTAARVPIYLPALSRVLADVCIHAAAHTCSPDAHTDVTYLGFRPLRAHGRTSPLTAARGHLILLPFPLQHISLILLTVPCI
ncbi:hypothetical protein FB451DRAFT_1254990 [Mycena latifolia]|nr:hypothetical protein FB451DRAFT_1254990 [Mycena latifolia]